MCRGRANPDNGPPLRCGVHGCLLALAIAAPIRLNGANNTITVGCMARPRQNKQIARLSVSFEKEIYERVTALADAHDVSTAWIIRKAVKTYLEDRHHVVEPTGGVARSLLSQADR